MANLRMTLLDLLNKSEQGADPNFLRDGGAAAGTGVDGGRGDRSGRR